MSRASIALSDLKLLQLIDLDGPTLMASWGIYGFFQKQELVYVGKTTSRTFIERIPVHFCVEPNTWQNILVKRHAGISATRDALARASRELRKDLRLAVVSVEEAGVADKLERLLLESFRPKYNRVSKSLKFLDEARRQPLNQVLR